MKQHEKTNELAIIESATSKAYQETTNLYKLILFRLILRNIIANSVVRISSTTKYLQCKLILR